MKHIVITTIAAVLLVGCATTVGKAGEARIEKKKRNMPPSETSIAIKNAIRGIRDFLTMLGTGGSW